MTMQVVVEGSSYWLDPGDQEDHADEVPDTQEQNTVVVKFISYESITKMKLLQDINSL